MPNVYYRVDASSCLPCQAGRPENPPALRHSAGDRGGRDFRFLDGRDTAERKLRPVKANSKSTNAVGGLPEDEAAPTAK